MIENGLLRMAGKRSAGYAWDYHPSFPSMLYYESVLLILARGSKRFLFFFPLDTTARTLLQSPLGLRGSVPSIKAKMRNIISNRLGTDYGVQYVQ